jgi:hypothetical protein
MAEDQESRPTGVGTDEEAASGETTDGEVAGGGEEAAETDADDEEGLPPEVIDEAETLTRRARRAVDDNEAAAYRDRRDDLLAEHGYRARIRDDERAVLVLYPVEWVEDGVAQLGEIENLDRGIERPLEGPGEAEQWDELAASNRAIAEAVEAEHGEVHGQTAHALADFMNNHYAKPIADATGQELAEFRSEYFPRNAWPSDDQKAVVEESVRLTVEYARSTERP